MQQITNQRSSRNQFPIKKLALQYQYYRDNKDQLQGSRIGDYIIMEPLGKGATGTVYKAIDMLKKRKVALKIMDKTAISMINDQKLKKIKLKLIQTEGFLMMKCNSDHIVKCYDIFQNQNLKLLVIEYCNGGTLQQEIISKEKQALSQDQAIAILKQLIFGLAKLHDNNIIHRDLKPENIFMHNGIYKIGDLGFSRTVQNTEQYKQRTFCGTRAFMAPQIAQCKPYCANADIWSLGAIFYMMICCEQKMSYQNNYNKKVYKYRNQNIFKMAEQGKFDILLKNGKCPSAETIDFFKKTLVIQSKNRINWEKLLQHSIFEKTSERISSNLRYDLQLMQFDQLKRKSSANQSKNNQSIFNDIIMQFADEPETDILVPVISEKNFEFTFDKKDKEKAFLQIQKLNMQQKKDKSEMYEMILEIQKCEWILKDIVIPIEKHFEMHQPILNKDRKTKELLYLLVTRAYIQLGFFKEQSRSHPKKMFAQYFKNRDFNQLYLLAKKYFDQYAEKLTKDDSKIMNIIKDKLNITFRTQFEQQKRIFLEQYIPVTMLEKQISFTYDNYICNMLPAEIGLYPEINQKIYRRLQKYQIVNNLKVNDLQNTDFLNKLNQIIE